MLDISKKIFLYCLIILIVIRCLLVLLLMFDIPSVGFVNHFPRTFGGDEPGYFNVAKNLAEFRAKDQPGFGTIGAAIVYVPYIWIWQPKNLFDIYNPVFIVQAFILYSISIILVVYICKKILKSNLLGILSGVIYVFYPYVLYFLNLGPYKHNYTAFLDTMWARPVLSDAPSAFFTYLCVAFFLWGIDSRHKNKISSLAGAVGGFAALVRITNIFVCAAVGIVYLIQKRFREFFLFLTFSLLVFSAQLLFNYVNYDKFFYISKLDENIIKLNEQRRAAAPPGRISVISLSPINYLYFLTVLDKYIPFLDLVLVLVIMATVLTFWNFYKKDKISAIFIFVWILFYLIFYGAFAPAARNARYWLPIIPAVIVMFIIFVEMFWSNIRQVKKIVKI